MAQAAMSHEGVSCDGCMMPNFSGCRYKCLRCWDFDLCHACYIAERFQIDANSDQQHEREHPMQCILSHHDFELFYADDESRNYATCRIAVLTCPYCNERGFGYSQFYEHVMRNHEEPMPYQVNCPLCIGLVDTESAHRVVDNLKTHWISVHYQYDPNTMAVSSLSNGAASASDAGAAPPRANRDRDRVRDAAAALAAAEAALGGAAAPGDPFGLPPTARNGARRPMMARRAARQQPPGPERTDRENRTENRETRQAAAAFGMPWTENEEDLFRLVQRTAAEPPRAALGGTLGVDRGRMQRLRNLQATLQQAPGGNLAANADFIQRLLGTDPNAPSYAGLVRGLNAEAAGEYAAPRPHGAPAPRSRTPPVNVIVALGSRPMTATQYDHARQESMLHDRSPSVSTLTSGDAEVVEDEDPTEEEAEERAEEIRTSSSSGESDAEEKEEEEEEEHPRENVDTKRTEEDDMVDALTKAQAIADTTLTQEEIVDMRRADDPFAVRVIDPIKAIRAHASNREWKVIKRMLKTNDLRAKDESVWTNDDGRLHRMDEEGGDSDDEIVVNNLFKVRPAGPKDEEDYHNNWLTVRADTSGLSFARDSYWKDKRFIAPRKLERQNSAAMVDEGVLARNALKALSITRALAGGKVLPDTTGLTQGEEIRATLGLWDMRATERREEGREREVAQKCDESLLAASRELDYDYDTAMLSVLRAEAEEVERQLRSQVGAPSSAMASARLEKQKKYLEALRQAGAGGTVVLQNPRDDPAEQQELERRLHRSWGTKTPAAPAAPPRAEDRPGPSH